MWGWNIFSSPVKDPLQEAPPEPIVAPVQLSPPRKFKSVSDALHTCIELRQLRSLTKVLGTRLSQEDYETLLRSYEYIGYRALFFGVSITYPILFGLKWKRRRALRKANEGMQYWKGKAEALSALNRHNGPSAFAGGAGRNGRNGHSGGERDGSGGIARPTSASVAPESELLDKPVSPEAPISPAQASTSTDANHEAVTHSGQAEPDAPQPESDLPPAPWVVKSLKDRGLLPDSDKPPTPSQTFRRDVKQAQSKAWPSQPQVTYANSPSSGHKEKTVEMDRPTAAGWTKTRGECDNSTGTSDRSAKDRWARAFGGGAISTSSSSTSAAHENAGWAALAAEREHAKKWQDALEKASASATTTTAAAAPTEELPVDIHREDHSARAAKINDLLSRDEDLLKENTSTTGPKVDPSRADTESASVYPTTENSVPSDSEPLSSFLAAYLEHAQQEREQSLRRGKSSGRVRRRTSKRHARDSVLPSEIDAILEPLELEGQLKTDHDIETSGSVRFQMEGTEPEMKLYDVDWKTLFPEKETHSSSQVAEEPQETNATAAETKSDEIKITRDQMPPEFANLNTTFVLIDDEPHMQPEGHHRHNCVSRDEKAIKRLFRRTLGAHHSHHDDKTHSHSYSPFFWRGWR